MCAFKYKRGGPKIPPHKHCFQVSFSNKKKKEKTMQATFATNFSPAFITIFIIRQDR